MLNLSGTFVSSGDDAVKDGLSVFDADERAARVPLASARSPLDFSGAKFHVWIETRLVTFNVKNKKNARQLQRRLYIFTDTILRILRQEIFDISFVFYDDYRHDDEIVYPYYRETYHHNIHQNILQHRLIKA